MVDIVYRGRNFRLAGSHDSDHIVRQLLNTGTFYEADLLAYIEAIKDEFPPGIAVDVGANIGNHAVFLAAFVRPVLAVEPNRRLLPLLRDNLAAAQVDHQVLEAALGSVRGRGTLTVPDEGNIGSAQIRTGGGDVEVATLDEACGNRQVALIKVDVEGMELEVLRGGIVTLTTSRPHLFLEAATRRHYRELKAFLSPLGYRPIVRWAVTPVWHFAPSPGLRFVLRARRMRLSFHARRFLLDIRHLGRRTAHP